MFGRKKKKIVKFHYKDRVEIIAGFYSGQTGILMDRMRVPMGSHNSVTRYQIRLKNDRALVWVSEWTIKKRTLKKV